MSKLVINELIQIPWDEFTFTAVRSQGPGGQNVNKVNTKVVLQWAVHDSPSLPATVRERLIRQASSAVSKTGLLTISSQRSRRRHMNQADCLQKLRVMILDAVHVPKERRPTKPTRSSQRRRQREKEMTSLKKKERRGPNLES